MTYRQLLERIGAALDEPWIVVPDTFLGIFPAAALPVKGHDAFLCSAVWALDRAFGRRCRWRIVRLEPAATGHRWRWRFPHDGADTLHDGAIWAQPGRHLIDNGIYAYEQFLIDEAYFRNPGAQPKPYVVLNRWDFVQFVNGLGVHSARSVNTVAALD